MKKCDIITNCTTIQKYAKMILGVFAQREKGRSVPGKSAKSRRVYQILFCVSNRNNILRSGLYSLYINKETTTAKKNGVKDRYGT